MLRGFLASNYARLHQRLLRHCAGETGMTVIGGIGRPRRGFSKRWQAKVAAAEASVLTPTES